MGWRSLKSESRDATRPKGGSRLSDDRWNPAHFGDTPRLIEESGQVSVFFDHTLEPPDPDDYPNLEAYEKAWQQWEAV